MGAFDFANVPLGQVAVNAGDTAVDVLRFTLSTGTARGVVLDAFEFAAACLPLTAAPSSGHGIGNLLGAVALVADGTEVPTRRA